MKAPVYLVMLGLLAGCGQDTPPQNGSSGAADAPASPAASANATPANATSAQAASSSSATSNRSNPFAQRSGELGNPDDSAMVMLYYDLAQIPPPIASWVEADYRLRSAPAPQKAGLREQLTREFEAARDAVKNVGVLRISLTDAQLSDYDPSYGEFTIGALSPSSTITFKALGQSVTLKFDNARDAQLWKVAAEEAQAVQDKIGNYGRAALDITLAISGIVPGPAGGTITTRIVEYELRAQRNGNTLARVRLN